MFLQNAILPTTLALFISNFVSETTATFNKSPSDLVQLNSCCDLWENSDQTYSSCSDTNINTNPPNLTKIHIPEHLMTNRNATDFLIKKKTEALNCLSTTSTKLVETSFVSLPVKPTFEFQLDGYLKLGSSAHSYYYEPDKYCINGIKDSNLEVIACKVLCTAATPCIHKCCHPNQFFDWSTTNCVDYAPGAVRWTPQLFTDPTDEATVVNLRSNQGISPWIRWLPFRAWSGKCVKGAIMPNYEDLGSGQKEGSRFRMHKNGAVVYWNSMMREWLRLGSDNYCMDGINTGSELLTQATFVCPLKPVEERSASGYFGVLCGITSMFSLLTVIVYCALWDKQNIHGWTTMSHALSITGFFLLLGHAHLTRENSAIRESAWCIIAGTLAHFFFIATFSWLTMISFDLWMTFRLMSVSGSKHFKRFLFYLAFGWGIPLVVIAVSWTLQMLYWNDETSTVKVPMYGIFLCYITPFAIFEYAYVPCGVLLIINLGFFSHTTWKLYQIKKSTRFATQNMKKDRQSYLLFIKLFIIVGALWIIEFVNHLAFGADVPWYVQITDTFNALQPVAIFVIFVCKADVVNNLMKKHPCLRPCLVPFLRLLRCKKTNYVDETSTLTTTVSTTGGKHNREVDNHPSEEEHTL